MDTIIRVECPACGKSLKAPTSYAGKKVTCKKCRNKFVIEPKQESKPKAPPPPPPAKPARDEIVIPTDESSEHGDVVWTPPASEASGEQVGINPFAAPSSDSNDVESQIRSTGAAATLSPVPGQGIVITGFKMSFGEMFWLVGKFMAAAWIWSVLVWIVLGTLFWLLWLVIAAALGLGGAVGLEQRNFEGPPVMGSFPDESAEELPGEFLDQPEQ